jgi:glycosyltransferase involved in cell wall biosynthesis
MTLSFFTNYIHHHQIPLADAFYQRLGMDYRFVAMEELPDWLIKGGYDPTIDRPYIIRAYESTETMIEAKRLMLESDVVIHSYGPGRELFERKKANRLTFEYTERWNKRGGLHLIHPRKLFNILRYHYIFRHSNVYMLCASAFAANDARLYGCYRNKCLKWGYFTKTEDLEVDTLIKLQPDNIRSVPKIMWCSRFLHWKHPELPVKLAAQLKSKGYKFHIDMFGSGDELKPTKLLASKLDVEDVVTFRGNLPNEEILRQMREHEIFLFTSDKYEGWGAVLNESMSNGCAVVASNMIGSVPFLIKDGRNGLIFRSEDLKSLTEKCEFLLKKPEARIEIGINAINTMVNEWSPHNAAKRFLYVAETLRRGHLPDVDEGPCSKA